MTIIELRDGYAGLGSLNVFRDGQLSLRTRTGARLLEFLWDGKRTLASREELLSLVWGYCKSVRSRTLDTDSWQRRRKLRPDLAQPSLLLTVAWLVRLIGPDGVEAGQRVRAEEREPTFACLQQARPPTPAVQAFCDVVLAWIAPGRAAQTRSELLSLPCASGSGTSGVVLRTLRVGLLS